MKLVTAFVGSARKQGVTWRATRQLLDALEARGDVRSELLFLSDHRIGLCSGCKACFTRGEECCPLHDDRNLLIEKLNRSDGVILASPVYSFQVSAHMKAFLDRLGFAFHRPRFFGKTFTSLVVEGLYGGKPVVKYLDFVGMALGFNVVKGSRVVCRKNPDTPNDPIIDSERRPMDATLAAQARRFHDRLLATAYPAPSLFDLFVFRMARTSILREQPGDRADPRYYRERGWDRSAYYYPTHLGPLMRGAGAAFDRLAARSSKAREHREAPLPMDRGP